MKIQVLRNNHLEKLNIFAILWLLLLGMSSNVYAQQFDHAYLKWKAEQQAQDAKLKKQDDNYYLSKPSLSTSSSRSNQPSSSKQASQLSSGSKISLNSANLEQLQQLNGVGAKKAQAIIDYRNQNGKFNSIDDLQKVKGIGPKLLEKNKSQLSL
ncbi:ComEA family DNA-binding protein [Acinetobacter wuhouensis]|uniref:ComEA family DNA-binding protein n=1 Tax=Acinetobacter wuhouensis TaxID=1879050 RepID=A0A3G2T5P0_9GAMM|nr:ComEA family DNA-binding protein [Acinetobacter wuhouensis]AYO55578.1 ComEA family DNA-binding protein [Acinetobacter wuhouensis]